MSSAFIMCCGNQERWKGEGLKQHVIVEGERLIDRTVRMCRAASIFPVVVSKHAQIGHPHITPENTTTLIKSMQSIACRIRFGDLILLGDTYYHTLKFKGYGLFGHGSEVFAIRTYRTLIEHIENSEAERLCQLGLPIHSFPQGNTTDFDTVEDYERFVA